MLSKEQVEQLLIKELELYVTRLKNNSAYFTESEAAVEAYLKVLDDPELTEQYKIK